MTRIEPLGLRSYSSMMAAYNAWMNESLYRAAGELTDEQRCRDMGAFFGSIHATLNHILVGDQAWMQRFLGEPVTMKSAQDQPYADFNALWNARRQLDQKISDWADAIDDTSGNSVLNFHSVVYQRDRSLAVWAGIVHMFNHQTHHRGQVTTLLKQLGKDPGITDLPWMPFFD